MVILIDERDGSEPLVRHVALRGVAVLSRLSSGDAHFLGNGPEGRVLNVGVEVKSIRDLVSSLESGRLTGVGVEGGGGQLPRMLADYDVTYLLYYGGYRAGPDNKLQVRSGTSWRTVQLGSRTVPYSWLEGFLLTCREAGVREKHAFDFDEAAHWLACAAKWWDKPWDKHRSFKKFNNTSDGAGGSAMVPGLPSDVVQRMEVARKLPGLGWERALAAANHFKSVREMVCASEQEWACVPGVGRVIARSIVRAVR